MKEEKIKVLALLPMELPKEIDLDNTLEAMQKFVSGLIECITLSDTGSEVTLVCNDEGKLLGLPLNRPLWDLHQRTREGLLTARLNGKQVGRKKGVGFETKKAREAKQIIRTHCKTFGGTLDDAECMKLTGLARNTYYKYKRQIRAELMAEQNLPKGASIFYEPPKSF